MKANAFRCQGQRGNISNILCEKTEKVGETQ